jgi:hypothetical protein
MCPKPEKNWPKREDNTSPYLEKYHFLSHKIKSRFFIFPPKIEPIGGFPLKEGKNHIS